MFIAAKRTFSRTAFEDGCDKFVTRPGALLLVLHAGEEVGTVAVSTKETRSEKFSFSLSFTVIFNIATKICKIKYLTV